ncbi:hypothetical protein GW933_01050 [Candidatus Falkowbacteria bacterium]|uniref:Tagatose-6-phosphate kinase n=1 Tax=Candidatus Buchananbacteria bacterium CG10_big_fil_rev_8_21_14_0_10_33_19 TaxID=1974525 RepID=A0A2H0W5D1_9BACT|nr:hypothetical protein [Candidatus Falkowbacteria bacterium]PIS05840.1 MAG: hypothetical protein COT80_03680 [Candidatus Buchananbacteria bacterium CG10_big_fil_rev_8_21_14_0_10_33_19]
MNDNQIELGFGPMSSESIEAVYRYSNYNRRRLMLIASKNQIDHSGGYVNNWTTDQYAAYISKMKELYPQAEVLVCRDHCGPGFNGNDDLSDVYKTIDADIKNNFDLIHIDFCHIKGDKDHQLSESKKVIEYCKKLNPKIKLEVGTDENLGINYSINNLDEIEKEVDYFTEFCQPDFFVVQTGTLIKEVNQVGNFNQEFITDASKILQNRNIKLKEHNADYLSEDEINKRIGIVGAMNIAPQLGVVQTMTVLNKCLIYGIDFTDYANEVYNGKKWSKWLNTNTPENKFLCIAIAGHYHFASSTYQRLIEQLNKQEDIVETIINNLTEIINHYAKTRE